MLETELNDSAVPVSAPSQPQPVSQDIKEKEDIPPPPVEKEPENPTPPAEIENPEEIKEEDPQPEPIVEIEEKEVDQVIAEVEEEIATGKSTTA